VLGRGDDLRDLRAVERGVRLLRAKEARLLRRAAGSDQAGLVGEHDGSDAVAQRELCEQVGEVRLDRGVAEHESGGDLCVG
jgi:hypothetical protein